jgi:isopentenyl-diphosphate delta-isomerase
MDIQQFENRKKDHLDLALDLMHQASGSSGLELIQLIHDALPELDFNQIELTSRLGNQILKTPFYVAAMTAGHDHAQKINATLAEVCQHRGWAMGVGSQRRDLELGDRKTEWKNFRRQFPNLILFGNIGLTQILKTQTEEVQKICDLIEPQILFIHLNSLQEVIQPEGTPFFSGGIQAIEKLTKCLKIPVALKETGCGFSKKTLSKIKHLKLAAVDISGLGGTHWGRLEGARAHPGSLKAEAAKTFSYWGVSTVDSTLNALQTLPSSIEVWASGGVRNGLDAAKLYAIGAKRIGYAQPALKAALRGEDSLNHWMETQEFEMKVAMFCTGSRNLSELQQEDRWMLIKK